MAITRKSIGSSVFRFFDGKTVETFETDEDFLSGTITNIVAGKVGIHWDGEYRANGHKLTRYYDLGQLTQIDKETYVLDVEPKSDTPDETPEGDEPGESTETDN